MVNDKIFVSVLMSAYAEPIPMLKEAIDSILNQTHTNLEFFVFLDKPDNAELWQFLQEQAALDSRLIVRKNEKNRFLAGTLNDELKLAKGDYMVRMDGDDVSVPYRIEHLVDYMESHPEVGVASSWMKEFGHTHSWNNRVIKYESDFEKMKVHLLCKTPIAHAACIIRRSIVDKFGPALYNEKCSKTQDYELWSRLIHHGVVFGMVTGPLYLRRKTQGAGQNPISFRVIGNQVLRRNVKTVLDQVNINLPDKVEKGMIDQVHSAINTSSGLLKNQLKMIQCLLYSNIYKQPVKRWGVMVRNRDLKCLSVLSLRMFVHFCRPGYLENMNNLVESPNQLIY